MNEFVARNGLIALDSSSISGPFVVTGSIFATSGISTSDNIGIGTSSPTAKLDVRGNISSSGNFTIGGNIYKSVDNDNLGLYGGPTNSVLNGFIKINGQSNNWGQVQINIGYEPDNSKGIWTLNDSTQLMTLTGRGRLGIGTPSPITTLDVRGGAYISSSTGVLLRVDGFGLQNILFVSSSGNVGVRTNTPTTGLDVNTDARFRGTRLDLDSTTKITGNYVVNSTEFTYLLMYNGSNASINMGTRHSLGYISFEAGNGAYTERMRITNTGNIGINTTLPTYRLDINGSFRASGSITATSGSDYFDIAHDITQPSQTGSQVYEVNITPTLRYTAPNQTQTALRVAATFSGSTALSSSQSNIIADFGSTSAGSQLVINDTTSGSIYMVNDVSGLPIIEANSNWDVFIYDYPNVVLKKTGSQIDITGKLKVSGSFILPLSQSTSPETGSAYWSGSFLYIYDGTQYRSASFS